MVREGGAFFDESHKSHRTYRSYGTYRTRGSGRSEFPASFARKNFRIFFCPNRAFAARPDSAKSIGKFPLGRPALAAARSARPSRRRDSKPHPHNGLRSTGECLLTSRQKWLNSPLTPVCCGPQGINHYIWVLPALQAQVHPFGWFTSAGGSFSPLTKLIILAGKRRRSVA